MVILQLLKVQKELSRTFDEKMTFKQEENTIEVVRPSDSKDDRTVHGTTRALLNNMVQGVSQGYEKRLNLLVLVTVLKCKELI